MTYIYNTDQLTRPRVFRLTQGALFSNNTSSNLSLMFHQQTSAMDQPNSVKDLASALVTAPSEQRKIMLGKYLHTLVYKLNHENADIVTQMILEMDESEVLHLLESPDALKAEVFKALDKLFIVERDLANLHALKCRSKENWVVSSALARKHTRKEAPFHKIPPKASSILPFVNLLDTAEELKAKVSETMEVLQNVEKQANRPATNTTVSSHDDNILDEYVFIVVDQLGHENTTEVTSLTPEMNTTKVSHLQALQAKVSKAMEMLTIIQQQTNSLAAELFLLSYKDNHAC